MEGILFMEGGQDWSPGGFCRRGNSCKESRETPTSLISPGTPGKGCLGPITAALRGWIDGHLWGPDPLGTGRSVNPTEIPGRRTLAAIPSLSHPAPQMPLCRDGRHWLYHICISWCLHPSESVWDLQIGFHSYCSYRALRGSRSKRKIHLLALLPIQHPKREADVTLLWWSMAALLHVCGDVSPEELAHSALVWEGMSLVVGAKDWLPWLGQTSLHSSSSSWARTWCGTVTINTLSLLIQMIETKKSPCKI